MERSPLRALYPFIAAAAGVFLAIDFCQSGLARQLNRGTCCTFPCEIVHAEVRDGRWIFGNEDDAAAAGLPKISIYRQRSNESGLWATTVVFTSSVLLDSDGVLGRQPTDFLRSLENWLATDSGRPTGHASALQTVRTLRAASVAPVPWDGCRLYAAMPIWRGILHNLLSALIALLGGCAAIIGFKDAAERRRTRAREAFYRCPSCNYDTRGLREPVCPECGGSLRQV